jgi:hypothetical protein
VDLYNAGPDSGSAISGIFIKNVLPNSPAGKTGQLKVSEWMEGRDYILCSTDSF